MADEAHSRIGGVFSTQGMATKAGKPFVMTYVNDEPFGQLTPSEAIAMGTRMIQSAIEAERDAGMIAFFRSIDMDEEDAGRMIMAMRDHRQQAEPQEGLGN
jgi:hypothetical protein